MLQVRGLSSGRLADVREAHQALTATSLPALDAELEASHGELFQKLVTARRHVDAALSPGAMPPREITLTQASRIGVAALVAALVAVGLYFALRTPTGYEATASARFGPDFPPRNVIDDDHASEWLLPDRSPGWVEVSLSPPERIETLKLLNGHNRHYNDRAVQEYTVEVYANGELARTIEATFGEFQPRPQFVEHALGIDDVERVRVNVTSWHRTGAALAEIDWE